MTRNPKLARVPAYFATQGSLPYQSCTTTTSGCPGSPYSSDQPGESMGIRSAIVPLQSVLVPLYPGERASGGARSQFRANGPVLAFQDQLRAVSRLRVDDDGGHQVGGGSCL